MVSVEPSEKKKQEVVIIEETKNMDNIEFNKPYVLQNILFEFDKDILLEESKEELMKLVGIISKTENDVTFFGHTDNVGSEDYNKELSTKRAKAVVDFLVRKVIR